jgi:hypothetical protein
MMNILKIRPAKRYAFGGQGQIDLWLEWQSIACPISNGRGSYDMPHAMGHGMGHGMGHPEQLDGAWHGAYATLRKGQDAPS